MELPASTVAFIRGRLTKVSAGAARGESGSKGGGAEWHFGQFTSTADEDWPKC